MSADAGVSFEELSVVTADEEFAVLPVPVDPPLSEQAASDSMAAARVTAVILLNR